MENYKENILSVFLNGTWSLEQRQYEVFNSISDAIQYAWDNWEDDIIATYYEGEKPEFAPISFIENWLDNEDLEADGYDVQELKKLFNL